MMTMTVQLSWRVSQQRLTTYLLTTVAQLAKPEHQLTICTILLPQLIPVRQNVTRFV